MRYKAIFEVLVEINGFQSKEHEEDYEGDLKEAVDQAISDVELGLDQITEELCNGLSRSVAVNLKVDEWEE